jgi:hypothetical protein
MFVQPLVATILFCATLWVCMWFSELDTRANITTKERVGVGVLAVLYVLIADVTYCDPILSKSTMCLVTAFSLQLTLFLVLLLFCLRHEGRLWKWLHPLIKWLNES